MHLLLDGQALQTASSRARGIGRFGRNLLRGLAATRPDWRIELVQNGALAPLAMDDRHGWPVLTFQPPLPLHPDNHEVNERFYADWLTVHGAEAVLLLSPFEGWEALVPSFCGPRPRRFAVVHDLIPLLHAEHCFGEFPASRWYAHRFRQLLQNDALLSNSEMTARDVRRLGGSDAPLVLNIGGAVDPLFAPLSPDELAVRGRQVRKRFGLQRDFLLYVGALDYNKNLLGALAAFAALPPEYRDTLDLAVVCRMKPAERASLEAAARAAGVASSLRWICSAGDDELRALYQMCRLFFFPSLYEGLGLPVLEALHCGAPVVTSNCSSLPEYAGPVSWLGDPACPEAMAATLQQALTEPRDARRGEREAFARSFSWQKTAERACAVMERTVTQRTAPARQRRRLAWVMPMTRRTRRLTRYAAALLPFLADRFDIELVAISQPIEPPEELSRRHLILTPAEVAARHAVLPYDMFLYQPSPAAGHRDMMNLLWRFPGLVVLHDFSLAELQSLTEGRLLSPKLPSDLQDDAEAAAAFTPVLGVLVHAAEAWQQVRRAVNVPVLHLEMPELESPGLSEVSERFAAGYAGWIDQAICRHEESDGLWRSFAVQALAECPDRADAVLGAWATLRARGQQQASQLVCGTGAGSDS